MECRLGNPARDISFAGCLMNKGAVCLSPGSSAIVFPSVISQDAPSKFVCGERRGGHTRPSQQRRHQSIRLTRCETNQGTARLALLAYALSLIVQIALIRWPAVAVVVGESRAWGRWSSKRVLGGARDPLPPFWPFWPSWPSWPSSPSGPRA